MPKILILYHFYRPDDVISAIQKAGLAEALVALGWEVEVWTSNRSCHHKTLKYSIKPETINGVKIRRVWLPAFNQHTLGGRILNSIWLQKRWCLRLLFTPSLKPDVILTGTDPLFTIISVPFYKLIRPKAKLAHWCFDLYPEAAIADGVVSKKDIIVRALKPILKWAYGSCDLIADLGCCMRERLDLYPGGKRVTLTPWALEEPDEPLIIDKTERQLLFGDAPLGLLYSGSFGRAHEFQLCLELARRLKGKAVLTYSARGSRLDELKKALRPDDRNIRIDDFAPMERLKMRLSCPDIHVVSLRSEWAGIVVPSKFFGALAVGRPVLFEGGEDSAVARWIKQYEIGWVLIPRNVKEIAEQLMKYSKNVAWKNAMSKHCHQVYQEHFSKKVVVNNWKEELKVLLVKQMNYKHQ